MSEKKRLRFSATLVYDGVAMHGGEGDSESKGWFFTEILGGEYLCLHDHGDLSGAIGSVEDFRLESEALPGGVNDE